MTKITSHNNTDFLKKIVQFLQNNLPVPLESTDFIQNICEIRPSAGDSMQNPQQVRHSYQYN